MAPFPESLGTMPKGRVFIPVPKNPQAGLGPGIYHLTELTGDAVVQPGVEGAGESAGRGS